MAKVGSLEHLGLLCCTRLEEELFVPRVLKALHAAIPSAYNQFFKTDSAGRFERLYTELAEPGSVVSTYFAEFHDAKEREAYPGFSRLLKDPEAIHNFRHFEKTLLKSDFYERVMRPRGARHVLWLTVRLGESCFGAITLHRSQGEPPFSSEEEAVAREIIGDIVHGLAASPRPSRGFWLHAPGGPGLILLNSKGQLRDFCPQAARILPLAMGSLIFSRERGVVATGKKIEGFAPLAEVCRRLRALTFEGASSGLPSVLHQNGSGRFHFRGHWFSDTAAPDSSGVIGVTVIHELPRVVVLYESLHGVRLSRKQKEICLLLAQGRSHPAIAQELQISPNTVTTHVRRIYSALEVRDHEELIQKLIGLKP